MHDNFFNNNLKKLLKNILNFGERTIKKQKA